MYLRIAVLVLFAFTVTCAVKEVDDSLYQLPSATEIKAILGNEPIFEDLAKQNYNTLDCLVNKLGGQVKCLSALRITAIICVYDAGITVSTMLFAEEIERTINHVLVPKLKIVSF